MVVMPGPVPGIHVLLHLRIPRKTWMAGTSPAMTEREPMCLMCEEEDLYFLYLERRERAERTARGETSPPNPNWLWPSFATAQSAGPAPVSLARHEALETPLPCKQPSFVCDTPDE
jgi:hypothetical protein